MKKLLLVVAAVAGTFLSHGQLVVENTQTVEWYVQNVLVGSGVTVSNVTFTGSPEQFGYFDATNASIGIDNGLTLSSGDITEMIGPASDAFAGTILSNPVGGDPDLLAVAQSVTTNPSAAGINSTNDVAILEFDFIPNGDTIRFDFVFASDEYTTWINTVFNDAFGFFVSGPGITGPFTSPAGFPGGSVNVANVPGTDIPITISTIYDDPGGSTPPQMNEQYYIDNTGDLTHTHNGFTTPITAEYVVQCGQTYHFKFAVADCQDSFLATSVFLAEGSFESSEAILAQLSLPIGLTDTLLYENCGNGEIVFTRFSNIDNPSVVELEITGIADNGVDYTFIPNEVIFQAGDSTASLNISAFPDGVLEGFENVVIEMTNTQTACGIAVTSSFSFSVTDDPEPLGLVVQDYNIDCGDEIQLGGVLTGGYGVYDYTWSALDIESSLVNPSTVEDSSIYVSPGITTTYILHVADTCNAGEIMDSIIVNVPEYPPVDVDLDDIVDMICLQQLNLAPNSVTGGDGVYVYEWVENGDLLANTYDILYTAGVSSDLFFTATDQCGFSDTDTLHVAVPEIPIVLDMSPDTAICLGDFASISGVPSGGEPPFSFEWLHNGSTLESIDVNPQETTTYILRVTDLCTAFLDNDVTVRVEDVNAMFSVTVTDPYGVVLHNGTNENSISASEIQYFWDLDNGLLFNTEDVEHTFSDFDSHYILLTAVNDIGCRDTASFTTIPPAVLYIPNSFSPNGDGINDHFGAVGNEIEDFEMIIFNRWGQQVFYSNDINEHWNGEGRLNEDYYAGMGVYTFKISGRGTQKERFNYEGKLTLIR
ncbi:MAG: choice-of-anchor L domain-containing protein [Bacteroidota bacterium]